MALLVACLCAQWCNTCKDFQPLLDKLASERAADKFAWVDIEEQEDLLGDLDVTNFPTILIAHQASGEVLFCGPITPHIETLQRLCQSADQGSLHSGALDAGWDDVAQQLLHH